MADIKDVAEKGFAQGAAYGWVVGGLVSPFAQNTAAGKFAQGTVAVTGGVYGAAYAVSSCCVTGAIAGYASNIMSGIAGGFSNASGPGGM